MTRAYIALGSNLGDRRGTIEAALRRLGQSGACVVAVSRLHETAPEAMVVAPGEQAPGAFLNAAAAIDTDLTAHDFHHLLVATELALGRPGAGQRPRNTSRTIDLDLLLFGELTLATPELTIPHPRMHLRRFVLAPLAEIAPDAFHPLLHKTARELLETLPSPDPGTQPENP